MSIKHTFVSAKAETTDSTIAGANEWNAAHTIDAGTIGTTELADAGVTTAKLVDASVTTNKLAANAVTTAKLATTGVTSGTYTNTTLTVGPDGRITSASSGAGGGGGGITNAAASNVIMKSDGANAVASGLSDDGTTVTTTGNRVLQVAASSLTDAYPLYIKGPVQIPFTVTDNQNGEIFQMTLTQANRVGLGGNSDCFGVVIRNQVNYNNTSHTNACGGGYFEASGARTLGAQALTNSGVEAEAVNGDINYAFVCYAGKGLARFDDGALCGPSSVTGAFTQTAGNVALCASGTNTCTISGATHITGTAPNLTVDGTILSSGAMTCNTTLRVNGQSNLDGGGTNSGYVFMNTIDPSGVPIILKNTIAPAVERVSVSTAASLILMTTFVTGTGTNLTLAAGTKDGQIKKFVVEGGTGQVTPSTLNGGTKYTWSGISCLELTWNATLTKWSLSGQSGMTLV